MPDWKDTAKALPMGRRIRTQCCSASSTLLLTHTERGYSAYCFRCKFKDWEGHGVRSIAEINKHRKELLSLRSATLVALPFDFTLKVPSKQATWYTSKGISPELVAKYGFGWSEYFQRIVLPVYDFEGNLIAYQLRSTDPNERNRYISVNGMNRGALFWSSRPNGAVIVTEDMLSAIKVGTVAPAVSLLGSAITGERAANIARECNKAIIWLDNDKAGKLGTMETVKQLQMQGVQCWRIESENDPKSYAKEQIKEHIRRMIPCH